MTVLFISQRGACIIKRSFCFDLMKRSVFLIDSDMFVLFLCTSAQSEEKCEILLGPEITYGPPGLNLSYPVAMTIAHCAEVSTENWNIKLKRHAKDNKWEVGTKTWHLCFPTVFV